MACAGVVASAGAQLEFTVMTVASRTVSKSSFFGFNSGTSTGSLSNPTLETQGGNARTCTNLEDAGSTITFTLTDGEDSDAAGYKTLIIDDLKLARSGRASFSSGTWTYNSSDDAISAANGSTIIVQLRAD